MLLLYMCIYLLRKIEIYLQLMSLHMRVLIY